MSKKNGIAAVGYARRSSDLQDRSIPDQKAYVERWAKDNGYRLIRWYVDDAISGTSTKGRLDFERLIADAENGRDFDAILCYDISRFSRGGTNETGYYLHRLTMVGVEAKFCAEGIPEGEEGELLQGVKSWQARQYSVKISRDCIRGMISHVMQKHCAPGGVPPYGYDKQHCTAAGQVLRTFRWLSDGRKQEFGPDGKLVRVLVAGETVKKAKSDLVRYVPSTPERIAVVKRIFEQCIAGYGYYYIADQLNKEGVASVDGGRWQTTQVRRILTNPVYRGALAWNKRTAAKLNGVAGDGTLRPKRGQSFRSNAKDDWFVVENAHEPLIAAEVFEQAQQAVGKRRGQGGRAKPVNRALLSGLITCTRCGHGYFQQYSKSGRGGQRQRLRYYTDGGYHRGGKTLCTGAYIPADAMDAFVIQHVRNVLLGDQKVLAKAVDRFVRVAIAHGRGEADPTDRLAKELEAVNRRIKTMVAMLADPTFDDMEELRATLAELKRRRDALREQVEQRSVATVKTYSEAELRTWANDRFRQFDAIRQGTLPINEARRLIHAFVARIEVDPKAGRGTLYLPGDAYGCLERELSNRVTLGGS